MEVDVAEFVVGFAKKLECLEDDETGDDSVGSCNCRDDIASHLCEKRMSIFIFFSAKGGKYWGRW